MVNLHIQKENPKIVHGFNMKDLGDKAGYCHCWRPRKVRMKGALREEMMKVTSGKIPIL
jgi:hypothetical protein